MLRVIDCITQEHDLRLVALAACLCALACITTVNLMAAAQTKEGGSSLAHLVAASVVFGCGVWSLHSRNARLCVEYADLLPASH